MTIPQSTEMHANNRDEVYYRVGDKSKKLSFDERLQLMYAKGARYFENEPVADSSIDDLDMDFVAEYCEKIGHKKSAEEYIRKNKKFYITHNGKEELCVAYYCLQKILNYSSRVQEYVLYVMKVPKQRSELK